MNRFYMSWNPDLSKFCNFATHPGVITSIAGKASTRTVLMSR